MSSNTTQYEGLAEQIESILQDPKSVIARLGNEQTRRRLVEASHKLNVLLEEPRDTLNRISSSHLQLPLALVGVDTRLFAALAGESRPFNSAELAEKTGMDRSLLKRLLRYYQATQVVSQVDDDTYQSNNVTLALSNFDHADTLRWTHKITARGGMNFPDWLQSIQYKDPIGVMPTAWSSSIPTDKHPFGYLAENPWALELAQAHMRLSREGRPVFFDALDFEKRFAQETTGSTVLFVDVGGSTGTQSLALRERYPGLAGRVIVQDRPEVVEKVKAQLSSSANIEAEVHDIFKPQAVKGARVYYMRSILHSWANDTCKQILLNAKAGMDESSVLLIDEMVLPEWGATAQGAQHDMEVMICVGGVERTKAQWESLLDSVGLKLTEVVKYDTEYESAVIVAGLN